MYYCTEYDNLLDEDQLLVATGRANLKAGDIVASAQAGGIFHKINQVSHQSGFTLMRAEMATLTEAIRYADFSTDIHLIEIDDAATLEQTPPTSLFDDVISGKVQLDSETVIHTLNDVDVYKCLGTTYTTNASKSATSYHLVVKIDPFNNDTFQAGDVLTSNSSSGFLETVLSVSPTTVGTFVKTILTDCSDLDVLKLKLSSPLRKTSCIGGDNNPGLLMYRQNTRVDLDMGDVVSGRKSSNIFAKVLKVRHSGSFVILEVANVERVDNGSAVTQLDPDDVTERQVVRRKRDVGPLSFEISVATGVSLYTDLN